MPIEYMFCFTCSEQCIKIISARKKCSLFSSVFKNIIPNNTTPTFQDIRNSRGIALTITKMIDFYSQGVFTFLIATAFNLNEPDHQLIAKLTLPHSLCSGL